MSQEGIQTELPLPEEPVEPVVLVPPTTPLGRLSVSAPGAPRKRRALALTSLFGEQDEEIAELREENRRLAERLTVLEARVKMAETQWRAIDADARA